MKFTIENIEEFSGGMAQIYSVMFEGDDMTLMDHFFEDNAQYQAYGQLRPQEFLRPIRNR